MSNKEQYKKDNTSLKKSIKSLEQKLGTQEYLARSYKRQVDNLRKVLIAAEEMVSSKKIAKSKLIFFFFGMIVGMASIFLMCYYLSS